MPLAVDPNIAAIIKAGKRHPQYDRAVRIYEQQKYQYDLGQQQEHSQAVARAELQRRAQSGELGKVPSHFLSQDEQAALAPINAKKAADEAEKKARADQAEAQRVKELLAKNPYKYQLEQFDKNPNRDGLDNVKGYTGSPDEAAFIRRRVEEQRGGQRAQIQGKSDLIDSVNDPYNKIQSDKQKEQYALQKDAQAKRDAAAAEIAKEYMTDPSKYESSHGKPAADAAGKIARTYLDQKYRKAGVDGVQLGGDIFDPEGKMGTQGTPAATGQTAGKAQGASRPDTATTGQTDTAATSSSRNASDLLKGGTSKLDRIVNYVTNTQPAAATSSAASGAGASASQPSTPSTPATPQGPTYAPGKKYDHIKHAQWFMTLPEDEKKRQLATMDDFQQEFLTNSVDAVKKFEPAFKAVEDAKNAPIDTLSEMGRTAMRRLGLGGNGQQGMSATAEKQPAPSYPAYSVPPVEATTAGERASQAVQSSVIPRRSNEPSPDWGIAYDAAKDALAGPPKPWQETSLGANVIVPSLSAAKQVWDKVTDPLWNKFTDPYSLKDRPSAAPVDNADSPSPDGSEDEKDPAVIARRLLNTPSAQF